MTDLGLNIVDCYQNMPKVCRYAIFQILKKKFSGEIWVIILRPIAAAAILLWL